jgi:uncharacterized protein (DUF2249 family)
MSVEPIILSTNRPGAVQAAAPSDTHPASSNDGSACLCGHDDADNVVLDSRAIPHAIRHATIFGALSAIQPGFALDLVASHNPLPLLAQLESRRPGDFTVAYLENGPENWTVRLTRTN